MHSYEANKQLQSECRLRRRDGPENFNLNLLENSDLSKTLSKAEFTWMNLKLLVSPQNQGRILLSCSKKQFVKEADIDAYMYIDSNNTSVYMEFN